MVAVWAAVANCFGLAELWRTELPCKTLSGHGELSLFRRHSQVHCPSAEVVIGAWAGPHLSVGGLSPGAMEVLGRMGRIHRSLFHGRGRPCGGLVFGMRLLGVHGLH